MRDRKKTHGKARKAFTLIELMVVMVVIAILVGAVLAASTMLVTKQKVNNTRAVLAVVRDSIEEFAREQTANPTVVKFRASSNPSVTYLKRYGNYPADELELFTPYGLPGSGGNGPSLLRDPNTRLIPSITSSNVPFAPMEFRTRANPGDNGLEHRDLAAMYLTVQLFGDTSKTMLSRVPERNWRAVANGGDGKPLQYIDRPPAGTINQEDEIVRYVVDEWNMPLSYLAQRDWDLNNPEANPSSNHPAWNEASTEIIRLNGGRPLIFSYGANGKEQLSPSFMDDLAEASIVVDWKGGGPNNQPRKIDHPLNADNVYPDAAFGEKLADGS